MTYFTDKQKVQEYIEMCKGTGAKELINILKKYLKEILKRRFYSSRTRNGTRERFEFT
mgnify:CR=1 FL=1|jgi:hypothetical protein